MSGREDMDHGTDGEGSAVLNGLHHGDILSFLQERGRLGPIE